MNQINFWEKAATNVSAIVEAIDQNLDNSYTWVTNLKEHESWCSTKVKEYFGLSAQIFYEFEQLIKEMIHPQDQEEYQEKMNRWLKGMDLDSELGSRIREKWNLFDVYFSCQSYL